VDVSLAVNRVRALTEGVNRRVAVTVGLYWNVDVAW